MEQLIWIFWAVFGICLVVAEIFTFGFVLLWFGIGAFAAALAGFLGVGIGWQFAIFASVSVALTVMSRMIFVNFLSGGDENSIKTGVDSLPGRIGTVTAASKGALQEGAVKVFGSTWTAFPAEDELDLIEGEKVEVVSVKGSSIYVRRLEKQLPEWRQE